MAAFVLGISVSFRYAGAVKSGYDNMSTYSSYMATNRSGEKAYYGILFGVTTLLFLSQARTATITLGIEIAVFFIITLVLSMKKRRLHRFGKLLIKVICVTLLSFYSAVSFISTYMQPPAENFSKIKDGYSYVSNNITSVVSDKEKDQVIYRDLKT